MLDKLDARCWISWAPLSLGRGAGGEVKGETF